MAAVAQNLDEEPLDPAEAEMPAAAFAVIQRAHQLCDHPAARELAAEPDLEQRAEEALSEARTILQDLDAESLTDEATPIFPPENSGNSPPPAEPTDEVKPAVDWKQVAQNAWHSESWTKAAEDYHTKRGKQRTIVERVEPEKLRRLRAVLADDVSLQRAYAEINSSHIKGRAFRRRGCAQ
jgi:hypothetical protein